MIPTYIRHCVGDAAASIISVTLKETALLNVAVLWVCVFACMCVCVKSVEIRFFDYCSASVVVLGHTNLTSYRGCQTRHSGHFSIPGKQSKHVWSINGEI